MTQAWEKGAGAFKDDREPRQHGGRKQLGENGLPQRPPRPTRQNAADRTKLAVTGELDACPHELGRTSHEE